MNQETIVVNETATAKPSQPMELTLRHQRLLNALVIDPDIQAACKSARIGRTAAYRWLKNPVFQDALVRQRDAALSEALAAAKTHATRAVMELARLLGSEDQRLRRLICNDIINRAMRVREMEDIDRRLTALEKANKQQERMRNT